LSLKDEAELMSLFLKDVLIYTNYVLEHLFVLQPSGLKLDLYFRPNLNVSQLRNLSPEVEKLISLKPRIKHPFSELKTLLDPNYLNLKNQNIIFSLTTKNPGVKPSGQLIHYMADQVGVYNDTKAKIQFHRPHYLTYEYLNTSDMNKFVKDRNISSKGSVPKGYIRSEEILDLVANMTTTTPYTPSLIHRDLTERLGHSLEIEHFREDIVKAFEANKKLTKLDYSLQAQLSESSSQKYTSTLKNSSKLLLRNLSNPDKFIGSIYK
jgi:uncharacterized protein YdhG (YjbR/CyaY superfamily)